MLNHYSGLLVDQMRVALLFPLFVLIALRARRTDSDRHKRMMIPATAMLLVAATVRMTWLPHDFPFALSVCVIAAFLPIFLWDVIQHRIIPRGYLIGRSWLDGAFRT